jgi:hypothetical protein
MPMKASRKRHSKTQEPRAAKKKPEATTVTHPRSNKIEFKEAAGKTLESVELWIESDKGNVLLNFTDKTSLQIDVAPTYMSEATYYDLKSGDSRPIRRWPQWKSPWPRP